MLPYRSLAAPLLLPDFPPIPPGEKHVPFQEITTGESEIEKHLKPQTNIYSENHIDPPEQSYCSWLHILNFLPKFCQDSYGSCESTLTSLGAMWKISLAWLYFAYVRINLPPCRKLQFSPGVPHLPPSISAILIQVSGWLI